MSVIPQGPRHSPVCMINASLLKYIENVKSKCAFVKSFSEEKGDVGAKQKCNCSIILHTEFGF